MDIIQFIKEQSAILIAIAYIIGVELKKSNIKDKYIPSILALVTILVSCFMLGFNIDAIIQGVLCWGVSIGINQVCVVQPKRNS